MKLWVWKDDGRNQGAWECPYCEDDTTWALGRVDEVTRVYTCSCGKRFKFAADSTGQSPDGSVLVLALTREVE